AVAAVPAPRASAAEPEPSAAPAAPPVVEPAEPGLWTPAPVGATTATTVTEPEPEAAELVEGESFSPAFTAAGNRHAAWVYEQIEAFLDFMPVDEWSVDHETGRYRQAGREFTVH